MSTSGFVEIFQDDTLKKMAELLASDTTHKENDSTRILEDLQWMSDHQLHKLVTSHKVSLAS